MEITTYKLLKILSPYHPQLIGKHETIVFSSFERFMGKAEEKKLYEGNLLPLYLTDLPIKEWDRQCCWIYLYRKSC